MLETDMEQSWQRLAQSLSCLSLKLNAKGMRDFPDQTVLCPGGHCFFIEFKLPGEEPRKGQKWYHRLLRNLGFTVYVVDNLVEARQILIVELEKDK